MKAKRFKEERLRNEEWFQFFTEFKTLVESYTGTQHRKWKPMTILSRSTATGNCRRYILFLQVAAGNCAFYRIIL